MSSSYGNPCDTHPTVGLNDKLIGRCLDLIGGRHKCDFWDHMANFEEDSTQFFNSLVSDPEVNYAVCMLTLHFRYYETAKPGDPTHGKLLFNPYLFEVYRSCDSEEDLTKVDQAISGSDEYTWLLQDTYAIFASLGGDRRIWRDSRALYLRSLWAWNRLQSALLEQVAACTHQEGCSRFFFPESTSLGTRTCCEDFLERSLETSDIPVHTDYRTIFTHGLVSTRGGGKTNADDEWEDARQQVNEPPRKRSKRRSSPTPSRPESPQAHSIATASVPPLSCPGSSLSLPSRGKRKAN